MERSIRATRREVSAYNTAVETATNAELQNAFKADFNSSAIKLKAQEQALKDFCNQTGLYRETSRLQVYGFDKSVSQKAVWAKKSLAFQANKRYNLGSEVANIRAYLQDLRVVDEIQKMPHTIDSGKQGKHFKTHNNYRLGNSYLTITEEEVQALVARYAGTGTFERTKVGKWRNQEIIHSENIIGCSVGLLTGEEIPTKSFKIHYSKSGVHIVPRKE